jgi:5-methylcytosine-specific restriction protein A
MSVAEAFCGASALFTRLENHACFSVGGMELLRHLKDRIQGKAPKGARRSSDWPRVRRAHLGAFPTCAACGGTEKIEVHHVQPFHLNPELELDPTNLISLCESKHKGLNCHLLLGHVGDFKSVNRSVRKDAAYWLTNLFPKK